MNDFVNCRSNFLRLSNLPAGRYVVVPSTYRSHEEGDYYLRVYTNSPGVSVSHLRYDAPKLLKAPDWCCFSWTKPFAMVTRIKVLYGKDLVVSISPPHLKRHPSTPSFQPTHLNGYFIELSTEKQRYRSRVIRNTVEPHWNWSTLIYRRSSTSSLALRLWASGNSCCGFNERMLMGSVEIDTPTDDKFWQYTMAVMDVRKRPIGTIALTVISSSDWVFGL